MDPAEPEATSKPPRPVAAAIAGAVCLVLAVLIGVVGLGGLLNRAKTAATPKLVPVSLVRGSDGRLSVDVELCAGGVRAVGLRTIAESDKDGSGGGGAVIWELHMQDVSLDDGDDAGPLAKGDMTGSYPVGDERIGLMTLSQVAPAKLPKLVLVEVITARGTGSGVFDTSAATPTSASRQPADCENA